METDMTCFMFDHAREKMLKSALSYTISNVDASTDAILTPDATEYTSDHWILNGMEVETYDFTAPAAAVGGPFVVANRTGTTFELQGVVGAGGFPGTVAYNSRVVVTQATQALWKQCGGIIRIMDDDLRLGLMQNMTNTLTEFTAADPGTNLGDIIKAHCEKMDDLTNAGGPLNGGANVMTLYRTSDQVGDSGVVNPATADWALGSLIGRDTRPANTGAPPTVGVIGPPPTGIQDFKGTFDATNVTFSPVNFSATNIDGVVLYKWTGNLATSPVIQLWDENEITGFAVGPNGGDIQIQFASENNYMFR